MAIDAMTLLYQSILVITIVVGVITTFVTYVNSRKLKGEIFEGPFVFFTLGTLSITLSIFGAVIANGLIENHTIMLLQNILVLAGFVFLMIASVLITKDLKAMESFVDKLAKK